ncbi:MAG TPA: TonB-dependent receptor [Luteitalea sp.]|nr:TonB-dependent receptor [Luteitalea sp.]
MIRRALGALLAAVLCAVPALAQEQQGVITGVVSDSSAAVLPGVTVEAKSAAGQVLSTVSDGSGVFRFPAVQPGTYQLTFTLQGFSPKQAPDVVVRLGQTITVNTNLEVGGLTDTVQVTSEVPLIDVKSNAAFANVSKEVIETLPKGRDFTSVVRLAPGANQENKAGGIQVDGASGSENRYYVDGVDSTNLRTGVSGKNLVVDFVEEVQVKSSGYNAEFRGATGGTISVVTKSGTNQFRGSAGTEYTNRDLEGDQRQTLRLVLTGQNQSEYITYNKDSYDRWYPVGDIGGPIFANRLWFYGGFSGDRRDIDRTVTFRTGGSTGTFNSVEDRKYFTGNITGQLTNALRLKVGSTYDKFTRDGLLPSMAGTDSATANYAIQGREEPNLGVNGQLDYVVTPRVFLSGKVSYLDYDATQTGIPNEVWHTFASGSPSLFNAPENLVRPTGFNSVPTNRAVVRDRYQRLVAQGDATFYVSAAGQHAFKTGVAFERFKNDVFDAEQQPHVTYSWDLSRTTLDGRTVRGAYGYYVWRQFGTQGNPQSDNLGFFLQDAWTVNNRLTINAGVRFENEKVPSYVDGLDGIEFDFADKFAPRLGVAYDPFGNGKTRVYGSWGKYYDIFKLELPRGAFGGDKWIDRYYTLDTLDWTGIGVNGNFPGTYIEESNQRIPSNDPSCPECGAIDPDLKPFSQTEFTAGLEHELAGDLSVGARYVHKNVDHAIEDVGVIVPGIGEVFYIANPGEGAAKSILGAGFPDLPLAKRQYDGVEGRITKRLSNNWRGEVIYLWSRLYGNYSGLASSDENGRVAPNVNRLFDSLLMALDQNARPVYGRLETDRPHQLKLNGTWIAPFGTAIGAYQYFGSGTPISRQVNVQTSTPMFYRGRASDGRMPMFTQTDIYLSHSIRLGGTRAVRLEVNVENLFDEDNVTGVYKVETRTALPGTDAQVYNGSYDVQSVIDARGILRDPRFLQPDTYQDRRVIRFGARFLF